MTAHWPRSGFRPKLFAVPDVRCAGAERLTTATARPAGEAGRGFVRRNIRRPTCYHFATQLGSTGRDRTAQAPFPPFILPAIARLIATRRDRAGRAQPNFKIAAWLYVIQPGAGFAVGFLIPWFRIFQ